MGARVISLDLRDAERKKPSAQFRDDSDRQVQLPCQDKSTSYPSLRHPPTSASFLARLLLDNPQQVSRVRDDIDGSFKNCHRPMMQFRTRPHNFITDRIMVEEKGSKCTTGKEPWGLRWRSSVGFVTFGALLLCALSRNWGLILDTR